MRDSAHSVSGGTECLGDRERRREGAGRALAVSLAEPGFGFADAGVGRAVRVMQLVPAAGDTVPLLG